METVYELQTFNVRLAVSEPELKKCNDVFEAEKILRPIFESLDHDQEHMVVLLLDNKNHIRGYKVVSSGSQTASIVHPAIIFRAAILFGACAIVISHNHPSGDPAPSAEDCDITRRITECGDLFGIRVLDHVIVGRGHCYSFNDRGVMKGELVERAHLEGINFYLWRKKIKRNTLVDALNLPSLAGISGKTRYAYLCQTLQGYRKIEEEIDAIADRLKITRDHLKLLIAGKAPKTEPL
jgi:hypothetical protein